MDHPEDCSRLDSLTYYTNNEPAQINVDNLIAIQNAPQFTEHQRQQIHDALTYLTSRLVQTLPAYELSSISFSIACIQRILLKPALNVHTATSIEKHITEIILIITEREYHQQIRRLTTLDITDTTWAYLGKHVRDNIMKSLKESEVAEDIATAALSALYLDLASNLGAPRNYTRKVSVAFKDDLLDVQVALLHNSDALSILALGTRIMHLTALYNILHAPEHVTNDHNELKDIVKKLQQDVQR